MSAWVRTKTTKAGEPRYHVQYRRGGRGWPIEHAGTFKVLREAKTRRDVVGGWLAQGLNPKIELEALLAEAPVKRTMAGTWEAFMTSRHDVTDNTLKIYGFAQKPVMEFFGETRDPLSVTVADCREFMGWLVQRYSPGTVDTYWAPFAQLFDFADIEPNPARHRSVKKPRRVEREKIVMTLAQFKTILARVPDRYVLFLRLLEATGMRIGELHALQWGDVDVQESRFRVSIAHTKTRSGQRWAQVPKELMDDVEALLPLEDRAVDRRVFSGVEDNAVKSAMRRACLVAGIPNFSPHDLRHRRLSLWHAQGVTARALADRAGHSRASMTLDVYSHVVVDAKDDEWLRG